MLDMGFGQEIDKCMANSNMRAKSVKNTLMFSATFAKDVKTKAAEYLKKDKVFLTICYHSVGRSLSGCDLPRGRKKEKKKTDVDPE